MPRLSSEASRSLGTMNTEQRMLVEALNGDIVLSRSPTALASTVNGSDTGTTRVVELTVKNAAGETHTWVDSAHAAGASIGDTSSADTATIASTTVTFTNGVAKVTVTRDFSDYADTETNTLTVATLTIVGQSVVGGTSVETFSA